MRYRHSYSSQATHGGQPIPVATQCVRTARKCHQLLIYCNSIDHFSFDACVCVRECGVECISFSIISMYSVCVCVIVASRSYKARVRACCKAKVIVTLSSPERAHALTHRFSHVHTEPLRCADARQYTSTPTINATRGRYVGPAVAAECVSGAISMEPL